MTELVDVVGALLYVAKNTIPFSGSNALYSSVNFRRGYPFGNLETPTVALYTVGGQNYAKGLGTVRQWREPIVTVDILTENDLEAGRIAEKLRQVWQADFDCDGSGAVGDIGNGYLRETGKIKDIGFSEAVIADWDEKGRVSRRTMDITVRFGDG